MEESLSAKSARLEEEMSALVRRARVVEGKQRRIPPPPPPHSPEQRVLRRYPAKESDDVYREIARRQASLNERAATLSRVESDLERRLARLEDEEAALPAMDDNEELFLSTETLRAARSILTTRSLPRDGRRQAPNQLDAAWLATLKSQQFLPKVHRQKKSCCWSRVDLGVYTHEFRARDRDERAASAALVVEPSSFLDFGRVFDAIHDAGGEVCSVSDSGVVALFFREDEDDELPVANAALAALACAGGNRGTARARVCCRGAAARLVELAHDEVKVVVVGEAVDRAKDSGAPSKPGRVAVDYASARVLVGRGWPEKAFSIADEDQNWLWLAVAKPLATKSASRAEDGARCRATTTSLSTDLTAATLSRCRGTVHRPVPWLVGGHQRMRPASFVTALCSGDGAEKHAAALNSATRAFGGITAQLDVVGGNGLAYTSIFFGGDEDDANHIELAASAALAAVVACPTVVGVSTGTTTITVAGSEPRLEVFATSSAKERSKQLAAAADRNSRVLLDDETMSRLAAATVTLELSPLSFPAGRPDDQKRLLVAASAPTDRKWFAAAALVDVSRTDRVSIELNFADMFAEVRAPSRISAQSSSSSSHRLVAPERVPESFQDVIVHNLVPGGRKRRAVTRDVASSALAAYREVFSAMRPEHLTRQNGEEEEDDYDSSFWGGSEFLFDESAWNAPPVSRSAFAALAPVFFASRGGRDDDDDEEQQQLDAEAAMDAMWIRSRGIPARASCLAIARPSLARLPRWRADYVRGSSVPAPAAAALSSTFQQLSESAQLLLRAAVIGAGSGGLETLRASTLAVAPLREAFAAAASDGRDQSFDSRFDSTIEDLSNLGLLVVEGTGDEAQYRVADPLLADAVYSATPAPRRKAVHAAHAASLRASLDAQRLNDDLDILRLAHHALLAREPDFAFAAVAEIVARGGRDYLTFVAGKRIAASQQYDLPFSDDAPFNYDRARAILASIPELRASMLAAFVAGVASRVLAAAAKLLAPVLLLRRRRRRREKET